MALSGVQQTDGAGSQVTGIFIGLAVSVPSGLLQSGKIAGPDKRLPGDHQALFVGDLQGDAPDCPRVVGHNVAPIAVSADSRLLQTAVFIGEFEGKAVQFEHDQHQFVADKREHFLLTLDLIHGEQRNGVGGLWQLTDRRVSHRLGRGIAHDDTCFLFQRGQRVKEPVIFLVAHAGGAEVVILMAVLVEQVGQGPNLFIGYCVLFHYAAASCSSKMRKAMIRWSSV